jgi:iron(III) transport system permease protein
MAIRDQYNGALSHIRWPSARFTISLGALLAVSVLVLIPLVVLVITSFRPDGLLPFDAGPLTLENYAELGSSGSSVRLFINTLIYAGGSLAVGLPIALGLAFLTERTDLPGRNTFYTILIMAMAMPIFATAVGWIILAGPRAGILNSYFRFFTGSSASSGPLNTFSMPGMVFVTGIAIVPPMWLLLASVVRNMDPALEEAAATSRVGRFGSLRRITIPLMRPGIAAVAVYYTIGIIESFEIPLAIGLPAGIEVLSTKIYSIVTAEEEEALAFGGAAALGVAAAAFVFVGILAYLRLVKQASRYAIITGKAYRPKLLLLGRWKYVALALVLLYILVGQILPLSSVLYTSLLNFYAPPVPGNFGNISWTFDNYTQLLDSKTFTRAIRNTVIVVVAAATITMLLVTVISWCAVRIRGLMPYTANVMTFIPLAIPGVITTLAFLLLFIGTPLYGTLALLVFAFTARYLSYTARLMYAAQLQLHKELEEVAYTSGAGVVTTFFYVTLRLLLPAFANGWLWVVTHAARDFVTPVLLATSGTVLLANLMWSNYTAGRQPESSAVIMVLIVLLGIMAFLSRRFVRSVE